MKKNKMSILLKIFEGSKLLLLLAFIIEVFNATVVFFWIKTIALLGMVINKGDMNGALWVLGKLALLTLPMQVIRFFILMPILKKIYVNINTTSKNTAYDHFSKINMSSLDSSTYLRINILGEYINTTIFNILTLTRDRIQFFLVTIISLLL